MIYTEDNYTYAKCDNCALTMGIGFNAGHEECRSTFRAWGWHIKGGKLYCDHCSTDPEWINREVERIRRMKACSMNG